MIFLPIFVDQDRTLMSEEKIIKHAENAVHVLKDKEKGWKKKLMGFIEEIVIIGIAVSLTLMFHNWNDELHEHRLARQFLIGIKGDLDTGALIMERNVHEYRRTVDYYDAVWNQLRTGKIDAAYIDSNSGNLLHTSYFTFDVGRFEGFKSSGYLRLIENQQLLKHLMTLYTVAIPFEEEADRTVFHFRQADYNSYIGTKAGPDLSDSTGNRVHASLLVNDPAFRFQIVRYAAYLKERQEHKLRLAQRMRILSDEIDKELNK
jgi:hypothetical protein